MNISHTKGRMSGLGLYAVLYLAFIYIPVLFLPLFSFNDASYVAFPIKGFTLEWFEKMAANPAILNALQNSIRVAVSAAILSTILGTLAAKAVTRYNFRGRGLTVGFIMLPLVIPGIILGISLLIIANEIGIQLSLYTIGAGHVLICMPFSMLVMISVMEGFDRSMEEAGLDLGENAWMTFWRVTFPIVLPGIVASLLLTFTVSFDEFVLAFFLSGSDSTLPIYIYSGLRFPRKLPQVLAIGACILVGSFLIVVFADWIRRRGRYVKLF